MALSKEEQQRAALERLEKFSRFTDSSIGIPFTRFRFGAEAHLVFADNAACAA